MRAVCRSVSTEARTDKKEEVRRLLFVQVTLRSRRAFEANATAGDIGAAAFSGAAGTNPGQVGGVGRGWGSGWGRGGRAEGALVRMCARGAGARKRVGMPACGHA